MRKVYLIINDVRSAHNVGSMFRTADGLGVVKIYLTGLTPYPQQRNDSRLPHVIANTERKLNKTALGAQAIVPSEYWPDTSQLLDRLKQQGVFIAALELTPSAIPIQKWQPPLNQPMALMVGHELMGLSPEILKSADAIVSIPMKGHKESLNVSVAAAIGIFYFSNS